MKKYGGYIIAALWFLLGAIALSAFLSVMKGNINPFKIRKAEWGLENTMIETYSAESVKMINAALVTERLVIEGTERNDIQVTIATKLSGGAEPKVSLSNGVLHVDQQKSFNFSFGFSNGYVEILIPYSMMKDSSFEIDASSVSGSLSLKNITAGNIDISSTSGSVRAENLNADNIEARSVSGSVKVETSQCTEADIGSTSGSVLFSGRADELSLTSTSGSVKAYLDAMLKKDSRFKSMSGSVRLTLPDNEGFTMKYSSMSGSVSNRFTGLRAEKSGTNTYKNGGITLTLESMSGSVSID
ncbi:MAG TPA: DUF4097 family beta strand repeat-containing protein [Treponemataceae bacterium]|nr:DUF4097 family beta strand repeat-containing protein [Treponemataceae bacterium]HQL04765.1 DUF4097 family beta strand repeat-containing protein [Treponemataceae bacterium]